MAMETKMTRILSIQKIIPLFFRLIKMDKERVVIKMQRHLRPLTAAPKKTKTKKSDSLEIRPVTASVSRSKARLERDNSHKKLIARQSLRKSHLQASGKSLDSDTLSGRGSSLDLTPIYDSQVELEIIKIVGAKNDPEQENGESLTS